MRGAPFLLPWFPAGPGFRGFCCMGRLCFLFRSRAFSGQQGLSLARVLPGIRGLGERHMPRMMVSTLALFAWTCSSQNQSGSVRLELGTWLQGKDESLPCSRGGGLLPPPTQDSAGWEQARDGEESTLEFGSISWLHSHLLRDCGVTWGSVREPLLLTSSAGGAVEMSGVKCSASGMPRLTNLLG